MAVEAQVVDRNREFLHEVGAKMDKIREGWPAWYAEYEDADPFFADREQVEALLATAPTEFASGYVSGIMAFRQQLALATGRVF